MRGLLGAVSFLTRVPVRRGDLPTGVAWFPLVGLGVGVCGGLAHWAVASATSPLLGGVAAVAVTVLVTGAFHEDGLADTFDGLASFRPVERQLEIMGDSRIGTFGAVGLVLVLVGRVAAIAALDPSVDSILIIGWAHAVAAAVVIALMTVSRPVAAGSGTTYLEGLRRGPVLAAASATAAGGWLLVETGAGVGLAVASAGSGMVWLWARRRIGGVTGDILGACQQVALLGALAVAG